MSNPKIKVVYAAYESERYIPYSIGPWISAAERGANISISIVSFQFKEYSKITPEGSSQNIDSLRILEELRTKYPNIIKAVYSGPPELEKDARNYGLDEDYDFLWIVDADEFYNVDSILDTIKYIQKDEFIDWYSIEFRNVVFDGSSFVKGFSPPRIFKAKAGHKMLFYYDNDIVYVGNKNINYKDCPFKKVPISICNPVHMTWVNNKESFKKVEYQNLHFGHCSYTIKDGELAFDDSFYAKHGIQIPELYPLEEKWLTFVKNLL